MKIGILTQPLTFNYGGILQAFALQTILKKEGHDAWLINYEKRKPHAWEIPFSIIKRMCKKYIFKKNIIVHEGKKYQKQKEIICFNTNCFIEKYILPKTQKVSLENFETDIGLEFDLLIVGSDQVWRPKYTSKIEDFYFGFLDKNNDIKRISYAASFGTDNWEYSDQQTNSCKKLVRKFGSISVRENTGVALCEKYFGVSPMHVLDPTLLLDRVDYLQLIQSNKKEENIGALFAYILDETEEKAEAIKIISENLKLTACSVKLKTQDVSLPLNSRVVAPVEEWINSFVKSKFILTDSFHGCVFSILFNKPFVIFGNRKRGLARFYSILSIFGLENRMIFSSNELSNNLLKEKIDWNLINKILKNEKQKSIQFLNEAISS